MKQLTDTLMVAEFMELSEQTVRTVPTADITMQERLLRVTLVIEEALEFAEAMGCSVTPGEGGSMRPKEVKVEIDEGVEIDLVESLDALADLIVVTKGSGLTLGLPVDDAVEIVHETNMAKRGPDGRLVRRPRDGKVIKPEGWVPPTERLTELLRSATESA